MHPRSQPTRSRALRKVVMPIRARRTRGEHALAGCNYLSRLALGVLRCFASALESVLLALFLTWIASEQSGFLQRPAQVGVGSDQRARNAVRDSTGLAGNTTTFNLD